MAAFVSTSRMTLLGAAWTGTAPGLPGTQTISGTISSTSDISAYVRGGNPAPTAAMLDGTNFASGGFTVMYPGLKSGDTITFDCISDFASSTLYPIVQTTLGGLGSLVYLDQKATNSSRGATNPSFVAAAYISAWSPIGGSVGELSAASLTLTITGAFGYLTS
jgi:hypothetical protein